ncbi:heme exporter protein CcmD [Vreelandella arcis]|uniref:Heme exporter protein D n=1 Tax=Vreelandella arcis TaxID=416873 RepID=A0A1H0D9E6_9GAMM|nr:heme exporter protein CcmD [Halomonas arcis]SDN66729.1 heme exporter protein D [Halomonas arcis]
MAFASIAEWLTMGGHGAYVWSAWGMTAALMAGLVLHARLERQQLIVQLKRQARRRQASTQPRGPAHDPDA